MPKLYLVWNAAKNECVGFLSKADADWTADGRSETGGAGSPSIGSDFREYYAEDGRVLPQTEIYLPA